MQIIFVFVSKYTISALNYFNIIKKTLKSNTFIIVNNNICDNM